MIKTEITKQCSFCGDNFTTSKSTARYCCNSCRTKANVKRRLDEQARAEQEAKHLQEIELFKQKADARRFKREEKAKSKRQEQEEIDKIARQEEEDKKIQAEIDAYEITEKKRLINSIVEMIRVKAKDKEIQLLVDEKRKRNDDRIRFENEMKNARENGEMIGKELADFIKSLNLNKNTGNTSTQPNPIITPTLPPKPGMSSQLVQTTPPPPATEPVRKSIAEEILNLLNIF